MLRDVCAGWFHLKCMGMKEGTNLLKGKEFVCHLCFFCNAENEGGNHGAEKRIRGGQR